MNNSQGRAIGATMLGGLAGGVLGVVGGGFLGPILAGVERHPDSPLMSLFDSCFGFVFMLIGAVIGGVLGSVSGAVLGAGLATSRRRSRRDSSWAGPVEAERAAPLALAAESTQTEIGHLKERLAQVEARKRGQPVPPKSAPALCPSCGQPRPPEPGGCPSCGEPAAP